MLLAYALLFMSPPCRRVPTDATPPSVGSGRPRAPRLSDACREAYFRLQVPVVSVCVKRFTRFVRRARQ